MKQHYYVAQHINQDVCRKSSSGGAFTAITDSWFLTYGLQGVVYGCAWDEHLKAKHIRAQTPLQRDAMRGSRYIGSDMSGVMRSVAQDLENKYYVVFSGTPCQIDGLKSFLQMKGVDIGDRLLTIEVICHGVGSVRFFEDYIAFYQKRYKSQATACSFRGKCRPGKRQQMVIQFKNGKTYESPSIHHDGFYSAYLKNYILRPSCYSCKYAQMDREADISIADYWGEKAEARSLMISNSAMGERWIKACMEKMQVEEIPKELLYQPNMHVPCKKPQDHEQFWNIYKTSGYHAVQRYLGNATFKGKVKSIVFHMIYRTRVLEILKK